MGMRENSAFRSINVPAVSESDAAARLWCDSETRGRAVVMHAHGEVDGFTLSIWQRVLRETAATVTAPGPMVVDLRGLDFMGCRAVAVLAEQATWCRGRGIGLRLVGTAPILTRMIAVAGLTELLPVSPQIDLATVTDISTATGSI